ncbi:flagellin lysine-N-methylase [Anaerovibrio slackiae]|uniref:flagellin lysine-N-methylase n=1 Tax=Anaerovibrio slackiae TaxID=2652309 RepID=UPI003868DBA7
MSVIQLEYVKNFICDGNKCNSKCCKKWNITIDENTYRKYKRIQNQSVRDKVLSSMKKINGSNGYMIILNENGECPLICKDKLCFIQRNLGPAALSMTCQTYPRKLLMLGECQLRSLSMTCPIAADMALFSDDGLAIEVHHLGNEHNNGWKILLQNEQKKKGINAALAETTIIASISILQNLIFSREERFILLGFFLDKADELKTSENAAEQILNLAIMYQSEDFIAEARNILSSFKFLADNSKKFMHELLFIIAANNQIGALNNLLKQAEDYTDGYDKWQISLENEYGKAINNYWLHEFFYLGYPFHLEGNFMHNYFVFLLSYKVWEIVLYGYLHVLGRMMTKEEFINLVGTYSKIMDHRQNFLPVIEKKAAECEAEPIKSMQMLLRLR